MVVETSYKDSMQSNGGREQNPVELTFLSRASKPHDKCIDQPRLTVSSKLGGCGSRGEMVEKRRRYLGYGWASR